MDRPGIRFRMGWAELCAILMAFIVLDALHLWFIVLPIAAMNSMVYSMNGNEVDTSFSELAYAEFHVLLPMLGALVVGRFHAHRLRGIAWLFRLVAVLLLPLLVLFSQF